MATIKVTKVQRYNDIACLLKGEPVAYGTTIDNALDFIAHEVELVSKKNAGKVSKMTDTQKQNKIYQDLIVGFLMTCDEGKTCTDIGKAIPELMDFNNQKISALMRGLVSMGKVDKKVVKGKSVFTIAMEEDGIQALDRELGV